MFLKQFYEDGARIEAAFRKHIHRASPSQTEDSYEVIVCHANVIRYFVCRLVFYFSSQFYFQISACHMCGDVFTNIT